MNDEYGTLKDMIKELNDIEDQIDVRIDSLRDDIQRAEQAEQAARAQYNQSKNQHEQKGRK